MEIAILNMSDDMNKGDFAIIRETVNLLRMKWPDAGIKILNVDYGQRFLDDANNFRHLKKLGIEQCGAFFPKVFGGKRNFAGICSAAGNLMSSFWIISAACLLKKRAKYVVPGYKRRSFEAVSRADLVVLKGGSYIYSYGGIRQALFLYRMLLPTVIALLLGRKVIILGHSIGPVEGVLSKMFVKKCLDGCAKVILREELSFHYLIDKCGVEKSRLDVWPDLVFNIAEENTGKDTKTRYRKARIGFTFREWEFPYENNKKSRLEFSGNYFDVMKKVVEKLARAYDIYFILHTFDDKAINRKLIAGLDGVSVNYLDGDYSIEELKGIYADLDVLVGTRTHSCIFALCAGTPVVPIAYEEHKGYGIMRMVEEGMRVENMRDVTAEGLLSRISGVLDKAGSQDIANKVISLKEKLARNFMGAFS